MRTFKNDYAKLIIEITFYERATPVQWRNQIILVGATGYLSYYLDVSSIFTIDHWKKFAWRASSSTYTIVAERLSKRQKLFTRVSSRVSGKWIIYEKISNDKRSWRTRFRYFLWTMISIDEWGAESGTEQFLKSMKWEMNRTTLASFLRSACRNLDEKRSWRCQE